MSSVDDLVISLTIKEGGNISKLQKQLTALVGKSGKGMGVGLMYLKKGQDFMRRDLKYIRANIGWLLPTKTPGKREPEKQIITAGILRRDIEMDIRALAEKMKPGPKDIKRVAGEWGLDITEPDWEVKLVDKIEEFLESLMIDLGRVETESFGGNVAELLQLTRELINRTDLEKGKAYGYYTSLQTVLKEDEESFKKLFEKYTMEVVSQVYLANVRQSKEKFGPFFKDILDEEGNIKITIDEIMKMFEISDKNFPNLWKKMLDLGDIGVTGGLKALEKTFHIGLKELYKEWKQGKVPKGLEEVARELTALMLPFITKKGTEEVPIGFPLFMESVLLKALKLEGGIHKWFGFSKIDALVTNIGDEMKAIELIGEEELKRYKQLGEYMWIDWKNVFSEQVAPEIKRFLMLVGEEKFLLVGRQVKQSFIDALEGVHYLVKNLMKEFVEAGLITPITEKESLEETKKARETVFEKERVNEAYGLMTALLNQQKESLEGKELSPELREFTEKRVLTYDDFMEAFKKLEESLIASDKTNKEVKGVLDQVLAYIGTGVKNPHF